MYDVHGGRENYMYMCIRRMIETYTYIVPTCQCDVLAGLQCTCTWESQFVATCSYNSVLMVYISVMRVHVHVRFILLSPCTPPRHISVVERVWRNLSVSQRWRALSRPWHMSCPLSSLVRPTPSCRWSTTLFNASIYRMMLSRGSFVMLWWLQWTMVCNLHVCVSSYNVTYKLHTRGICMQLSQQSSTVTILHPSPPPWDLWLWQEFTM